MKFSQAICELSEVWILWCRNDLIARDENKSWKIRKEAAVECEKLIKRTYQLMDIMNEYFEKE
jgi:hypothetical protein